MDSDGDVLLCNLDAHYSNYYAVRIAILSVIACAKFFSTLTKMVLLIE